MQEDFLFTDHSFPDARCLLEAATPDLMIVIRGGAQSWQSPILVPLMSRISGGEMDKVDGLRLIQQWGADLEGVDVAAASACGIAVANVPTSQSAGAESVVEWCVMSALTLITPGGGPDRSDEISRPLGGADGTRVLGRTACINGLGDIAKAWPCARAVRDAVERGQPRAR